MPSKIDHYTCTKTLGSGISAKVKLATAGDGSQVALKIFDKQNPHNTAKAMETLKKEVDVYKNLQHPYMVNLIEFKEHAEWVKSDGRTIPVAYMALELITGGELFDYVALRNFSPETCRYYFNQMLQVMHYMHFNTIAHRDLKPENIMLDKNFNIRFADFGFASQIQGKDGSGFLKTILGTTAYMAPELIQKQQYQGHVVDLFALGIILFILYSGHPPFNSANPTDPHYRLLAEGRADVFWRQHSKNKKPNFFTEEFKDLITNMLQLNPTARLSLADIAGHAWMQGKVTSAQDVRSEFQQRADMIKQQQAQEAAQKAQTRRPVDSKRREAVRAVRGEQELGPLKIFDEKDVQVTNNNVYFSTYEPKDLLDLVQGQLIDDDIRYEQNEWKITYEVYKEQSEDEAKLELPKEGIRVKFKIMKYADEKRFAMEFQRLAGSRLFFNEQMQKMIDSSLGEYIDAVGDQ